MILLRLHIMQKAYIRGWIPCVESGPFWCRSPCVALCSMDKIRGKHAPNNPNGANSMINKDIASKGAVTVWMFNDKPCSVVYRAARFSPT